MRSPDGCLRARRTPAINGKATPVSPGTMLQYKAPDMFGRPWAKLWEEYHEKGMTRPAEKDIFDFSSKK